MAGEVVDLPEPVMPVTSIIPRRSMARPLEHLGQVQLLEGAGCARDVPHHAADFALARNRLTRKRPIPST
jgi:hypothetical protein